MSRATNQSIYMLALIAGCCHEILRQKLVSHVQMRAKVQVIFAEAENCINNWDETGVGRKNKQQMQLWRLQWEKTYIHGGSYIGKSAPELMSICDHLLTDLLSMLKVPWKRRMIESLHQQVQEVYTWLDSDWRNLPALESAGLGVGSLEAIINN